MKVTSYDEAVRCLLNARNAAACIADAAQTNAPQSLFGSFWHEGELAVLFADCGVGKSLLAVQIADAISFGRTVNGFGLETSAQKVVFVDFEQSDKQFEQRYTNADGLAYSFSENFIRVTVNPDIDASYLSYALFEALENLMKETGARVLVMDSLTLHTISCEPYPGREKLIVKRVKLLQQRLGAAVLLTLQVPKSGFDARLTLGQLGASRYLMALTDSVFAMGQSCGDEDGRYLLHLRNKGKAIAHHKNCVAEGRICNAGNFPHFEVTGTGSERHHLQGQLCALDTAILAAKRNHPEGSLADIAKKVGTNRMKVKRVLDRIWEEKA